ncbi:hypothetical protein D3C81_2130340 [compost metagenome]
MFTLQFLDRSFTVGQALAQLILLRAQTGLRIAFLFQRVAQSVRGSQIATSLVAGSLEVFFCQLGVLVGDRYALLLTPNQ